MTVLTKDMLVEILDCLDACITKMREEVWDSTEFQMDKERAMKFYEYQYDTRLQNLLLAKKSEIHHLESSMKNMVIQRKMALLGLR